MTQTDTHAFTGWDIGGAHIKVARCDAHGQLISVLQLPCPLWQGIEQLQHALTQVLNNLDNQLDQHYFTMTGELVDIFPDRQSGVSEIIHCITSLLNAEKTHFFAAHSSRLSAQQAINNWQKVASMNWLVSANYASGYQADGLFIDIGSTTTDIIPLQHGAAIPQSWNDQQRQQSRELVYSGAIRTPLMALTLQAPFQGQQTTLAAEYFASTGDCWRLLEQLEEKDIQDTSADGQSWATACCQRRLARMLGADASAATAEQWYQLATWFTEQQIQQVTEACLYVLSAHQGISNDAPFIGAGVGRFIVQQCAQRLHRPYNDFSSLPGMSAAAASHAPAAALALLAQQQLP